MCLSASYPARIPDGLQHPIHRSGIGQAEFAGHVRALAACYAAAQLRHLQGVVVRGVDVFGDGLVAPDELIAQAAGLVVLRLRSQQALRAADRQPVQAAALFPIQHHAAGEGGPRAAVVDQRT